MSFQKVVVRSSLAILAVFAALLAIAYFALGMSPSYIYNAPSVATGIGAKLACSGRYVSGYSEDRMVDDIATYSAILTRLNYSYDETHKNVTASFFGLATKTAQYRPGIGCSVVYDQETIRKDIQWPVMRSANAAWPKGNGVLTKFSDVQSKLDAMLERDNEQGHDTRALLVVHRGKIRAESYAEGVDENTPLIGWSMTKSVNGLILGQLEMQGKVDVGETGLFTEWNDERAGISVEHLLQMTDGLSYEEEYDPGQKAGQLLFQEPSASRFMKSLESRHEPGKHFEYSSGTSLLLGDLVQQRIAGDVQADVNYIVNEFFRPMGMTSVTYEMDSAGLLMASSYLFATARDWARIGQLMLNKGELNDIRFMSEDFVERSVQSNNSENRPEYGYQWWLNTGAEPFWPGFSDKAFAAMGNREQRVFVSPEDELVIVRIGWSPVDNYPDNENFLEIRSWLQ